MELINLVLIEAINNIISIEQALLLNPNLEEVIKEQKEFKDKFGQIDQLTLGTAINHYIRW